MYDIEDWSTVRYVALCTHKYCIDTPLLEYPISQILIFISYSIYIMTFYKTDCLNVLGDLIDLLLLLSQLYYYYNIIAAII